MSDDRIAGLAQVNLIVTDLDRAKEFWALLGRSSVARHEHAAVITFASGFNIVLHEPSFAQHWDPAYDGPSAGSTVIDVNLPSRHAVDEAQLVQTYPCLGRMQSHHVGIY